MRTLSNVSKWMALAPLIVLVGFYGLWSLLSGVGWTPRGAAGDILAYVTMGSVLLTWVGIPYIVILLGISMALRAAANSADKGARRPATAATDMAPAAEMDPATGGIDGPRVAEAGIRWDLPLAAPLTLAALAMLGSAANSVLNLMGHGILVGSRFASDGLMGTYFLAYGLIAASPRVRAPDRGRTVPIAVLCVSLSIVLFVSAFPTSGLVGTAEGVASFATMSLVGMTRYAMGLLSGIPLHPVSQALETFGSLKRTGVSAVMEIAGYAAQGYLVGRTLGFVEGLSRPAPERARGHAKWMAAAGAVTGIGAIPGHRGYELVPIVFALVGLGLHARMMSGPFVIVPALAPTTRRIREWAVLGGAWAVLIAATAGSRKWTALFVSIVP